MFNALQTKSLIAAVLLTTGLMGSMLLKMNDMAAKGVTTAATQQADATTVVTTTEQHITLAPVTIVGRRDTAVAQADITSSL